MGNNYRLDHLLAEDLAWYGRPTARALVRHFFLNRTFRPVATLRLAQHPHRLVSLLGKAAHRWACGKAAVDLPSNIRAGSGLKLTHGWGAVVSPGTVIGRDVIIMHGATLGMIEGKSPVIEDGAFIGANAIVIGGIRIGRGATVSAGAIVARDVEPDTMVASYPSHVVKDHRRPVEKIEYPRPFLKERRPQGPVTK